MPPRRARYAALLRGVAPMNASMPESSRAFERAGFEHVKTVLASGNVLFDAPELLASAERVLTDLGVLWTRLDSKGASPSSDRVPRGRDLRQRGVWNPANRECLPALARRRRARKWRSVPRGIRTLVATVKGWSPGPLDDGDGGTSVRTGSDALWLARPAPYDEGAGCLGRAGLEPATVGLKARCSAG